MYDINRFLRLSQTLVHFVIDRASLFTDHRISSLPFRTKCTHFNTCESILVTILLPHRHKEQILPSVVETFCWITHNIAPHISLHDLAYHKTMEKYEKSQSMEAFLFLPREFAIQTWFCKWVQSKYTWSRKDVESPKSTSFCSVIFESDHRFVSCQPILRDPHTQMRTTLFDDVRISIPNWKPSPNRAPTRFSQIPSPKIVLPMADHTESVQEEQLGLRY